MATWNYLGELLGVSTGLLPSSLEEVRTLLETILQRRTEDSAPGHLLTSALLAFTKTILPARLEHTAELLMAHLMGRKNAALLGVQTEAGCLGALLPEFIRAYFNWGEKLEDKLDRPIYEFVQGLSKLLTQGMVQYFDQYKGRHFAVPDAL